MKRILLVLGCVFALNVVVAPASYCETISSSNLILNIIEEAKALDLTEANLNIQSQTPSSELWADEKFMGLLQAKLRLAKIFSRLGRYGNSNLVLAGYDVANVLGVLGNSGSVDMKLHPFDLSGYAVYHLILPLQLEPVIRELPAYYRAVVSTPDWEQKFAQLSDFSLESGKIFYLAGFPRVNKALYYAEALELETGDGKFFLSEYDSSVEGWLYSFWLRRYNDGSMEVIKKVLDWLNATLDEVGGAKG